MFGITKCFAGSESKSDDLNSSNLREKLGKIAERANEFHVHGDATLSRSFGFLNSKQKKKKLKKKEKVTPESSVLYTQVIINGISPPTSRGCLGPLTSHCTSQLLKRGNISQLCVEE